MIAKQTGKDGMTDEREIREAIKRGGERNTRRDSEEERKARL